MAENVPEWVAAIQRAAAVVVEPHSQSFNVRPSESCKERERDNDDETRIQLIGGALVVVAVVADMVLLLAHVVAIKII